MEAKLNEQAVRISLKLIKKWEGCRLVAYPDVASDLAQALTNNNLLSRYLNGRLKHEDLPENFQVLSGNPWTIGWGETLGVNRGDVWTQEQADKALELRVREFMQGVLKACPKLAKQAPERIAAVTSLAYNIGLRAFSKSSVCSNIVKDDHAGAAASILLYNKANGKIVTGLQNRRDDENKLYRSVS